MRTLIVDKKYDNKKLDVFLLKNFDGLSINTFYKALRKKDILVNGVRVKENTVLNCGDNVTLYITDNYLFKQIDLKIVFEDDNILVVNKPSGIEVVSNNIDENTVTSILQKEFGNNIMPCHRLDRNTFGLVLFAKNKESLDVLLGKFKTHEIEKYYKCTVVGIPKKAQDTLKAFLFKDSKKSMVYIYDEHRKGSSEIITSYKLLETHKEDNTAVLEVILHTGKTHQIRAHLAHIGHPILGDGKYGKNDINKKIGKETQDLCAYKLKFNFKTDAYILNYLNNKEIKI